MKNYLLIGGSYGIGASLAKHLSENAKVFIASRTAPEFSSPNIVHIESDVTKQLALDGLPEVLDGFVFLPGSINLKPFKSFTADGFSQDMEINFFSMVRTLQSVLPKLQASQSASVVLFSSVAATSGMPFHTSISAAKAAVEGFARSFAAEFAPTIRINVIAPSLTNTPLATKFLNSELKLEKSSVRHPLKRVGNPEDIASMAAFLLDEKNSWITGQVFHVDGGMSSINQAT